MEVGGRGSPPPPHASGWAAACMLVAHSPGRAVAALAGGGASAEWEQGVSTPANRGTPTERGGSGGSPEKRGPAYALFPPQGVLNTGASDFERSSDRVMNSTWPEDFEGFASRAAAFGSVSVQGGGDLAALAGVGGQQQHVAGPAQPHAETAPHAEQDELNLLRKHVQQVRGSFFFCYNSKISIARRKYFLADSRWAAVRQSGTLLCMHTGWGVVFISFAGLQSLTLLPMPVCTILAASPPLCPSEPMRRCTHAPMQVRAQLEGLLGEQARLRRALDEARVGGTPYLQRSHHAALHCFSPAHIAKGSCSPHLCPHWLGPLNSLPLLTP